MQGILETPVRSLGQEDPLKKEVANPLQYSHLENPMDRGAWRITVHMLGEAHWLKPPPLARHHSNHLHELFYDRRPW